MDVTCSKCQHKFTLPAKILEKIPKGKSASIPCPKCKNKIPVKNEPEAAAPQKEAPAKAAPAKKPEPEKAADPPETSAESDSEENGDDDTPGNPFDFLEEGTQTALLCEGDADKRAKMKAALESLEFHISEPKTHRDALKQMRFHDFDLILINERFGTRDPDMNHILKHLEQLPMVTRRNMFVALVSERFRTMDNMMTFNKSVNLIINMKDLERIQKILDRGIKDNDAFYRVYKESYKKIKE
jgi:DNA-directed RNA polymerase subunit RPC12/RpoP